MQANVWSVSLDPDLNQNSKEKVKIITTSISILGSMIDDILDIAKFEQGVFKHDPEEFLMIEFLSEIREIFEC